MKKQNKKEFEVGHGVTGLVGHTNSLPIKPKPMPNIKKRPLVSASTGLSGFMTRDGRHIPSMKKHRK